jgi:3-deoxy-7-phosphoheptulonate synthase
VSSGHRSRSRVADMIIVMNVGATAEMLAGVCRNLEQMGLKAQAIDGTRPAAVAVTGDTRSVNTLRIRSLPGVKEVIRVTPPYRLVSRAVHSDDTVVNVGGIRVGGNEVMLMAGPCAVESREQCLFIAEQVAKAGVRVFRGGAYKPRTSPYSFQGLGPEGLEILVEVRERFGMRIVTEAVDTDVLSAVAECADLVQIGARNMQNFSLLKKAGQLRKPVLLKRGLAATLEEFLLAAEYIMAEGNHDVILCERGVRSFSDHTRYTLDLSALPYLKQTTHLPIIVDPSHGTGHHDRVLPLARAAVAAGADGLLIEVHHDPANAFSDGRQAITPDTFEQLTRQVRAIAAVLGRACV